MPQLFPIYIEVEEIYVGKVIRLLDRTPGVANVDLQRGKKPKVKPNGEARPRGQYATPGNVEIEEILFDESPMTTNQLAEEFGRRGRSPKSVHSLVHKMKNDKVIVPTDDGYLLAKSARDRVRLRRKKKQKGGK